MAFHSSAIRSVYGVISVVRAAKKKRARTSLIRPSPTVSPPKLAKIPRQRRWVMRGECLVDADRGRLLRQTLQAPVVGDDAPNNLVVIDAVAAERTAQHAFLHGADLAQRAV